jgi:hypothetical protein
MLELRPNCECCNKDLPPEAADAVMCSFECAFCRDRAETTLGRRCPNCGGNWRLVPYARPRSWRIILHPPCTWSNRTAVPEFQPSRLGDRGGCRRRPP